MPYITMKRHTPKKKQKASQHHTTVESGLRTGWLGHQTPNPDALFATEAPNVELGRDMKDLPLPSQKNHVMVLAYFAWGCHEIDVDDNRKAITPGVSPGPRYSFSTLNVSCGCRISQQSPGWQKFHTSMT